MALVIGSWSKLIIIAVFTSALCIYCSIDKTIVYGDNKQITLTLDKSSFAPLTTVHGNQLSISVKYQVNDKSVAGEKINGLMKIYSANGTLIHSTSFPTGFDAKKKGGDEELKTTIRDPSINQIVANVTFTDLKKTETLSNTVTAKLNLNESSGLTANNNSSANSTD